MGGLFGWKRGGGGVGDVVGSAVTVAVCLSHTILGGAQLLRGEHKCTK